MFFLSLEKWGVTFFSVLKICNEGLLTILWRFLFSRSGIELIPYKSEVLIFFTPVLPCFSSTETMDIRSHTGAALRLSKRAEEPPPSSLQYRTSGRRLRHTIFQNIPTCRKSSVVNCPARRGRRLIYPAVTRNVTQSNRAFSELKDI